MSAEPGVDERPVVVGVDGSPGSDQALAWAIDEAGRRALPIRIVGAWRTPLVVAGPASALAIPQMVRIASQRAEQIVDAALRRARAAGIDATGEATEGHPADVLIAAAAGADQIVVGDRGAGAVGRFLLGSVSSAVAHHAQLPVTVVRGRGRPSTHRIVVGVDGSKDSCRALERAATEATAWKARLVVVGAWRFTDPDLLEAFPGRRMPPLEDLHAEASARVEDAIATTIGSSVEVETDVLHATPADALIQASERADLLLVGSRGLGAFDRMLLGSVSTACLHHASCPVQIVR